MVLRGWSLGDWDPWRELDRVHRGMHRMLDWGWPFRTAADFPAVNVWSDAERVVLTTEVPGLKAEDLDVSVQNDVVTIAGHREAEKLAEGEALRRQERPEGSFARTVLLPFGVKSDTAEAAYRDGVLRLTLHRSEESKPRKIAISG